MTTFEIFVLLFALMFNFIYIYLHIATLKSKIESVEIERLKDIKKLKADLDVTMKTLLIVTKKIDEFETMNRFIQVESTKKFSEIDKLFQIINTKLRS